MRILKPLMACATLLTLAAPALASAEPYFAGRGHGDGFAYNSGDYSRGYNRGEGRRWERRFDYRDDWRYRDHDWRYRDHDWRYHRGWYEGGWR
jgi:hypothetical protein